MKHIPLKAESFSSLSRIFLNEVHHERINWPSSGATSRAQWSPSRPSVIPVFSSNVFGWERRLISIKGGKTAGINRFILGPITIAISPIAQHALLQTEINSKKRNSLRITKKHNIYLDHNQTHLDLGSEPILESADRHEVEQAWNMPLSNHQVKQTPTVSP